MGFGNSKANLNLETLRRLRVELTVLGLRFRLGTAPIQQQSIIGLLLNILYIQTMNITYSTATEWEQYPRFGVCRSGVEADRIIPPEPYCSRNPKPETPTEPLWSLSRIPTIWNPKPQFIYCLFELLYHFVNIILDSSRIYFNLELTYKRPQPFHPGLFDLRLSILGSFCFPATSFCVARIATRPSWRLGTAQSPPLST